MTPKKIIVLGTLANDPFAGMAWMHMQIFLGLKQLGHEVYYFEITSTWPYNPVLQTRVDNADYAVPYLKRVADYFGIGDYWAYRCSFTENKEWFGMPRHKAESLLAHADLVLNISGATFLRKEALKTGRLVYYGTDPVYFEIKYEQGDTMARAVIDEHQDAVTYGENIGDPACLIPPLPNLRAKTRQPVIMEQWQNSIIPRKEFTTVGNWKQGGRDLVFNGETYYWSKHYEFLKFIDLPIRLAQPIELAMNLSKPETFHHREGTEVPALGVADDEYSILEQNGWQLAHAPSFTTEPGPYKDYIQRSRGEFTFAKDQNVRLQSGWFSERSACYLAAGRPVITQDTGFGSVIPTGEGLFAFNTLDEIKDAFEKISSDYKKHSKAAGEIAMEYFRADKVMKKVLDDLGV